MTAPQVTWTPNQQAARQRIVDAAADLIGRDGLEACTLRAVADEAGLKKSTVHYYFEDANELVDLSVNELFGRYARQAADKVDEILDGPEALAYLVRLFMGRASAPPPFRDGGLWPAYISHALRRGAREQVHHELELFRAVFTAALAKSDLAPDEVEVRSASVHDHLLGAMVRNMVRPIPRREVARAVSAVAGIELDPDRC